MSQNIKEWYAQKVKENHPSILNIKSNPSLSKLFETEAELGSDNEDNDHIVKPININDEDEYEGKNNDYENVDNGDEEYD